MKKALSTTLKTGTILLVAILLGFGLLYLVFLIPTDLMTTHVAESCESSLGRQYFIGDLIVDDFTDVLMVDVAYHDHEGASNLEKALNIYTYDDNQIGIELLDKTFFKGSWLIDVPMYGRYWHGYLIWLKPLLLIFNLSQIHILNLILQTFLMVAICILMWRKCRKLLVPYLICMFLLPAWVCSWSLQYSSCFDILNLGILIVLLFYERLERRHWFGYLFLILGIMTSFFDLLTYPLITLLMPLVVVLFMKNDSFKNNRARLSFLCQMVVFWGVGYLGFWVSKWILTSILLGNGQIWDDALHELWFRMGSDPEAINETTRVYNLETIGQSLARNLFRFFLCGNVPFENTLIISSVLVIAILYLIHVIVRRPEKRVQATQTSWRCDLGHSWLYWLVMLAPYAWYVIVANHSMVHSFFTYKVQIATMFAGMAWFMSCIQTRQKILTPLPAPVDLTKARIAVLIPCYNEALTIAKVVSDYRAALPMATIYVYDNASTDESAQLAAQAGALVRQVPERGKGNVMRAMFREIEADCYLMVDGDATYQADNAVALCEMILRKEAEMAVGNRLVSTYAQQEKRKSHIFGNWLVRWLINTLYGQRYGDIMSGQRAFSREFVKNFACKSNGFTLETEMALTAANNHLPVKEVPVTYVDRIAGSYSKVNTRKDGLKILKMIGIDYLKNHPCKFFGSVALFCLLIGYLLLVPMIFALYFGVVVHFIYRWTVVLFGILALYFVGVCYILYCTPAK